MLHTLYDADLNKLKYDSISVLSNCLIRNTVINLNHGKSSPESQNSPHSRLQNVLARYRFQKVLSKSRGYVECGTFVKSGTNFKLKNFQFTFYSGLAENTGPYRKLKSGLGRILYIFGRHKVRFRLENPDSVPGRYPGIHLPNFN